MGNSKNQKESNIKRLDKDSESLGMGGYLATETDQEVYKDRMQKRKEIQSIRE